MELWESILLLLGTILIIGGAGALIYFLDNPINDITPKNELTKQLCESSNGRWIECGNKCSINNQGNPEVACAQVCEEICQCGMILGLGCPAGYNCILPEGIADVGGYCEKA